MVGFGESLLRCLIEYLKMLTGLVEVNLKIVHFHVP